MASQPGERMESLNGVIKVWTGTRAGMVYCELNNLLPIDPLRKCGRAQNAKCRVASSFWPQSTFSQGKLQAWESSIEYLYSLLRFW